MAGIVKFYHGSDATKYLELYKANPSEWEDALFFDTNNKVIYKSGDIYGGAGESSGVALEQIQGVFVEVLADENNGKASTYAYTYSFKNYAGDYDYSITIPAATSEKSGLMLPSEKTKLNSINLDQYVIKEDGKGLSSNDFTDKYIEKISDLEGLAEPNVIEKIKVDNVELAVAKEDKSVNIELSKLINARVGSTYVYKGSVEEASSLPNSGNSAGDVYNIVQESDYGPAGTNVAWVETTGGGYWDALAGVFDTTALENKINGVDSKISGVSDRVGSLEAVKAGDRLTTIEGFLGDMKDNTLDDVVNDISLTNIANALKWEEIK